jgi:M6 family metalloprotease-like protein
LQYSGRKLIIFLTVILTVSLVAGISYAKVLTIEGTSRSDAAPKVKANFGASDRNLLGLEHTGKYMLPKQALSADQPRTIRVLAIKVNFKKEVPDDPLSTGNGNFDLRTKQQFEADEGHLIDATPHNSDYFNAHLTALESYWQVASNGRVKIEWDIYPIQDDSAYQLDSTMAYYGGIVPQYGLTNLFFDAFAKADADTGLKFHDAVTMSNNYDAYIIFHPGADQQTNMGEPFGPDTPYDLYTGYVKLGAPVPVDSGRVMILDGLVMPETASQDNRVTALNAVFAHEFGHQLGLVDLYDTRTFVTMCGDFALMDNNGLNVNIDFGESVPVLVSGVMPIFPSAWSRAYLGFVDVVEVTHQNNLRVAAAELDTTEPQVVLVPINADEYFLLENRRTDLDGIEPTAVQADSLTDVILWPRSPEAGQSQNNREYDFLIPGSGMLIWHIDESVARMDYNGDGIDNFDENQLQWFYFPQLGGPAWDNHRRFVRLMEADGIEDFGGEYLSGYGRQEDMFEINGNSNFGPNTNPPSCANNNGYTGITIDDISAAFRVMSCDIATDGKLAGWPNFIGKRAQPLTAYDLDGDGSEEIVTAVDGRILAYRFDGTSLFTPDPGDEVVVERNVYYGDGIVKDTLAVYATLPAGEKITQPPSVLDLDGDGFAEVVVVTDAATVACYTTATLSFQGEALKLFEASTGAQVNMAPLLVDYDRQHAGSEIVLIDSLGERLVFSANGDELEHTEIIYLPPSRVMADPAGDTLAVTPDWESGVRATEGKQNPRGAALADFNRDGVYESAEIYMNGELVINYAGLNPNGAPGPLRVEIGEPIFSGMSLADLDGDGHPEMLFCGNNRLYAYNYNGTAVTNFPFVVNAYIPAGPVRCNPTVADVDGDGRCELFVGTANGEVAGFDLQGNRLAQYPRAAGGTVEDPPVFATHGSQAGLFALSYEGEMNGFATAKPADRQWNSLYGSSSNLGSVGTSPASTQRFSNPIAYLYNYPNPASYETRIRFGLRDNTKVTLRLYNLAGDLVFDTKMDGQGSADNEYELDCSPYASGVYFCVLETEAGDRQHCSIAILK